MALEMTLEMSLKVQRLKNKIFSKQEKQQSHKSNIEPTDNHSIDEPVVASITTDEIPIKPVEVYHITPKPRKIKVEPIITKEEEPQQDLSTPPLEVIKLYDQVYVINLDRSIKRWEKIDATLTEAGIEHVRFPAVDGYKIKIINLNSNYECFGQEFKDKKIKTDANVKYKIICNPESDSPTSFIYNGAWKASAGELGIICSNRMVYKDALEHNYQQVIIFEDDVIVRKPKEFNQQLSYFMQSIPSSFDIAYIDMVIERGKANMTKKNHHVYSFHKETKGYGLWSFIVSEKGLKKLIAFDIYSEPIDLFYIDNFDVKHSQNNSIVEDSPYLEAYASLISMVGIYATESTITNMGR